MYSRCNKWEKAHRVATEHMTQAEVAMLYITQAHRLESSGKYKEAERLYVMVHEPDLAINMHKKGRRYDDMIRLVTSYRKDLLHETHQHLAQQLEMDGALREAEQYYCEAGEWQSAVNMWRANDSWDEAIRIAKFHGGVQASQRVAYAWALSIGGEQGSKLLTKLGLIEQAIDYAIESGNFDHAFDLARKRNKDKKVTLIDKQNAMPAQEIWSRTVHEVAQEYSDITHDHAYIDAACMWMVKNPEWFDVAVVDNMMGDIITDLGAAVQGGMGLAASGNIHPGQMSMFEPIHGSAPKHAGKGVICPLATISALQMMLDFLGEDKAAARIDAALAASLTNGSIASLSTSSGIKTSEYTNAVLEALS